VEVGIPVAVETGAQVACGSVLALALGRDITLILADRVDRFEILYIEDLRPASLLGRCEELRVNPLRGISTKRHIDGAIVAMSILGVLPMKGLEL
jgi:hypothetical protein